MGMSTDSVHVIPVHITSSQDGLHIWCDATDGRDGGSTVLQSVPITRGGTVGVTGSLREVATSVGGTQPAQRMRERGSTSAGLVITVCSAERVSTLDEKRDNTEKLKQEIHDILFEEQRNIPEGVYIRLMDVMKRYTHLQVVDSINDARLFDELDDISQVNGNVRPLTHNPPPVQRRVLTRDVHVTHEIVLQALIGCDKFHHKLST